MLAARLSRDDRLLAAALVAGGQAEVWLLREPDVPAWALAASVLGTTGAVTWRRSRPTLAALVFAGSYVAALPFMGEHPVPIVVASTLAVLLVGFSLAAHEPRPETSLAGALALVVALWADDVRTGAPAGVLLEPVVGVSATWIAGRIAFRERALGRELARANAELADERRMAERAAAAEERERIAREVHDVVGHSLTAIAVQADVAQAAFDDEPERARRAVDAIDRTARAALVDVRRAVGALRDAGPSPMSLHGIGDLVATARDAGTPVRLDLEPHDDVSAAIQASAYRLVQEALTNVRRHAPGAGAEVVVRRRDDGLLVRVANGPGGQRPGPRGSGHGLAGARERVAALGGRFRAGPDGRGGWVLEAVLPLEGA